MEIEKTYNWKIAYMQDEAPDVQSLFLEPIDERPSFIAGQYLTIKIPGLLPQEGKAYSIASAPHEPLVRITIKKMGEFSSSILAHKVGDIFPTSIPYGFFYPEETDTNDTVFIVGGIGITPVMSIIQNLIYTNDSRNVHLIYSNKTKNDVVFLQELTKLHNENETLSITHHLTREEIIPVDFKKGRVSAEKILSTISKHTETDFFICGSIGFTRDIWKDLRNSGIPQHKLYTESFF